MADANGTIQCLICDDRSVVVGNAFLPVNLDLRILVSTLQGLAVGVAGLVQRPLGFHNNPRQLLATVNRGTVQSWLLWFVGCAKKALLESANIIGGLEDELRMVGRDFDSRRRDIRELVCLLFAVALNLRRGVFAEVAQAENLSRVELRSLFFEINRVSDFGDFIDLSLEARNFLLGGSVTVAKLGLFFLQGRSVAGQARRPSWNSGLP